MMFGYVKEKKLQIIGIKTINRMNIDDINNLNMLQILWRHSKIFSKKLNP